MRIQPAHDVRTTLLRRRLNVLTSIRRGLVMFCDDLEDHLMLFNAVNEKVLLYAFTLLVF